MHQHTLAEMFATELGLDVEFNVASRQVLFGHRHHGTVYSCDWYVVKIPGAWMSELCSAVDLLNTFPP
jgi:hypothetical protein